MADERFLVLINDLLASGEIPDLFPDDEVENVVNAMRPEVKGAGLYDSKDNCWKFFINRVRRTLKVRDFCLSRLYTYRMIGSVCLDSHLCLSICLVYVAVFALL